VVRTNGTGRHQVIADKIGDKNEAIPEFIPIDEELLDWVIESASELVQRVLTGLPHFYSLLCN
jgi:hypothetical protein